MPLPLHFCAVRWHEGLRTGCVHKQDHLIILHHPDRRSSPGLLGLLLKGGSIGDVVLDVLLQLLLQLALALHFLPGLHTTQSMLTTPTRYNHILL